MKLFTFLLAFSTSILLQAQVYPLSFGDNNTLSKGDLSVEKINDGIQIGDFEIKGDLSGIDQNDYITIKNNQLKSRDTDTEIKFISKTIDISAVEQLEFEVEVSGVGTLDNSGKLKDWVDVHYYLGDEKFSFSDNDKATSGIPENIVSEKIEVGAHHTFRLEISMLTTGDDEIYTIGNVRLEFEKKEAENIIVNKLEVFPNPTSDFLYMKNVEVIDLSTIEILDTKGQFLQQVTYPINVAKLATGIYFVNAKKLNGAIVKGKFTVIR